eukprot:TRINITY_DN80034_c0_g1_i1.p2 TRINITY_DN80034_c0_g1~~TRINITY_DN80034_c0_g1_i1.p2  ORF type:complete len:249 (-),score=37.96 TRINITY_DN80034_c0_g1_i1:125-871(-)
MDTCLSWGIQILVQEAVCALSDHDSQLSDVPDRIVKRARTQLGFVLQSLANGKTSDLCNHAIRAHLVRQAADVYNDSADIFKIDLGGDLVAWYSLSFVGEDKVMAIRGTQALEQWKQDLQILQDATPLVPLVEKLVDIANSEHVKFVCGHSLGGILAEAVASHTGAHGASFNGLSVHSGSACLFGKHFGPEMMFEVHQAREDPVFQFHLGLHIGEPKIHDVDGTNPIEHHSIDKMRDKVIAVYGDGTR